MRLFREPRAPTDPQVRAEQYRLAKRRRVVAGIDLAADFSALTVAMVQGVGQGKYLRVRAVYGESYRLAAELQRGLQAVAAERQPAAAAIQELASDLAQIQSRLIHSARGATGKLGDQLCAVALSDPGIWQTEFDGRPRYVPLTHPETIAEQTGVCVIDALPAKDLAAGGHGRPLTPLAIWLALADRSAPIARELRLVVAVESKVEAILLPPSDGLDELYPEIRYRAFALPDSPAALAAQAAAIVAEVSGSNRLSAVREATVLLVASEPRQAAAWQSALEQAAGVALRPLPSLGFSVETAVASWTAILGMLFIDQLPANLTWLTGAETPRILGRLTPGAPAAWRQLLREMADHPPPAMRLRDAV